MSIPVSSGIGTGAAQIYSFDKTAKASQDLIEYNRRFQEQKAQEKAKRKEKQEALRSGAIKAIDESVDYSKLMPADVEPTQELANGLKDILVQDPEGVINGSNKELATAYRKGLNTLQQMVNISTTTKPKALELLTKVNNSSNYDLETTERINNLWSMSGTNVNDWNAREIEDAPSLGMLSTDLGLDKKVFYKPKYIRDINGTYIEKGQELVSDEEGASMLYNSMINGGTKGIKHLSALNNIYGIESDNGEKVLDYEGKLKVYKAFKDMQLVEPDDINKNIQDKETGGVANTKTSRMNVSLDVNGNRVIAFTKPSGEHFELSDIGVNQVLDAKTKKLIDMTQSDVVAIKIIDDKPVFTVRGYSARAVGNEIIKDYEGTRDVYIHPDNYGTVKSWLGISGTFKDWAKGLKATSKITTSKQKAAKNLSKEQKVDVAELMGANPTMTREQAIELLGY